MNRLTQAEAEKDFLSKEAFDMFDKDSNGYIDKDELLNVLHCLGQNPTPQELQAILNEADVLRDGKLRYEEYNSVIKKYILTDTEIEVQLREAFVAFDHEKRGHLNITKIEHVLTGLGEDRLSDDQVEDIMKQMDTNGDGVLDIEEIISFLCKKV